MSCKEALRVLLGQVDYTAGACRLVEMVGAVLPKEVIVLARAAIEAEENSPKSSKVANDSASDNTDSQKCLCDLGSSATSNVWLLTINKDCPVHGDKWEG